MSQILYSMNTPRLDIGEALHEFMPDLTKNFIGTRVAPIFGVGEKAANYPAITRESILRRVDVKRATGGDYNRDGFNAEDYSYACVEYGLEHAIDDSEQALYASRFDAELEGAKIAMHKLMVEQEIRIASLLFNTGTWTGATLTTTVSTAWSTVTSDIIGDVEAAKQKVYALTGMEPNTLILSSVALGYLLKNTAIVGRIQYTQTADRMTILDNLANVLGLDRIEVGYGMYNAAKEGQTFSGTAIWNAGYAMVAYVPRSNSLSEPATARTFLWTADSPQNVNLEMYREEQRRSNIIRVRQFTDEVVVDASFAHLLDIAP